MRKFGVADVETQLRYVGLLEDDSPALELRWRMYQSRQLGLMYTPDRIERLFRQGEIAACFLFEPHTKPQPIAELEMFVPEPFPVPADVYEHVAEQRRADRVGFLSELAYHKLAYEGGRADVEFASADAYGLYCALIEQCYAPDEPYRAQAVYWILFRERGITFFEGQGDVPADLLEEFLAARAPAR